MSGIRTNQYADPNLARAFENLSSLFMPPSGSDLQGYAAANATKQKAEALAQLIANPNDPDADRKATFLGSYNPTQSWRALEMSDATQRYGVDRTYQASTENNAADNARALQTSAMDNQRSAITSLYGSLAPGEIAPAVPGEIMGAIGMPAIEQRTGAPKPLSETEFKAQQQQRLLDEGKISDDLLIDVITGQQTPVKAVGPNGQPVYMSPGAAVRQGAQPAKSDPQTVVNMGPNGVDYGDPGKGLVWARNPDNTVKLDDRGAPVAIPFQGGEVWQQQEAAKAAADVKEDAAGTKNDVVLQDLDRALSGIGNSPALTTGVGAQLLGPVGGSAARDVNSLLDTVRANVGFAELQQMRDSSPTGGALGQVTEKEQKLLQSVLGSLDTAQSAQQLTENLKRLKNVYLDVVHGPGKGPQRERLGFEDNGTDGSAAPVYATNPQTGERLVLRNGAWEPVE